MNRASTVKGLFQSTRPAHEPQRQREPILLLTLDNHLVSFPTRDVMQVVSVENFRRVACSNRFIAGIIHIGGRIVPVINLSDILDQSVSPHPTPERVAVIDVQGERLAIPTVEAFYSKDYELDQSRSTSRDKLIAEVIVSRGRRYQVIDTLTLLQQITDAAS